MSKKITVETIQGKPYTVIRRPFDAEWVRDQLAIGIPVVAERVSLQRFLIVRDDHEGNYEAIKSNDRYGYYSDGQTIDVMPHHFDYTLTILPALPRHPKPEDAPLLYRYMAEGIEPWGTGHDGAIYPDGLNINGILHLSKMKSGKAEITHATFARECVEIAITDEAHNG